MKDPLHTAIRLSALLLSVGALAACGAQAMVEPTTTAAVTRGPRLTPTVTESASTEPATPADGEQDADPTEQTPEDAACITCHANVETLQVLAVEEEPAESLSSGEG